MAHHGDLATSSAPSSLLPPPRPPVPPLARVHRPRLAIMTPPPPTTITLQPLATAPASPSSRRRQQPPPNTGVTLTAPRPDGERTANEYVETPFRPSEVQSVAKSVVGTSASDTIRRDPHHQSLHLPIGHNNNKSDVGHRLPGRAVVTKQPNVAATFKKAAPGGGSGGGAAPGRGDAGTSVGGAAGDCFRGSIICPECGRCRCESCRKPRPLPSRWLCNNACFCSAETSLDYASCLCCVKGLFYHCSKDYELDRDGTSCADDPCSCEPHRLLARWGCLGVLSLVLPCLWCYWPLRGCVGLCEKCYARYSSQGCRCEPRRPKLSDLTPEKRLLDTSPDF